MGIGDIVGGLLVYDAIQSWRDERRFGRQLDAYVAQSQAEYEAARRARPADIRALLLLEWSYRGLIEPLMSGSIYGLDAGNADALLGSRGPVAYGHEMNFRTTFVEHLQAVAYLPGQTERGDDTPYTRILAAASPPVRSVWETAAGYTGVLLGLFEAIEAADPEAIRAARAEYDRWEPQAAAFWKSLRPSLHEVAVWQFEWDQTNPPPWPNDNSMPWWQDEEDCVVGWHGFATWESFAKKIDDFYREQPAERGH